MRPLKVILVDDETIVTDDLRSLIDWRAGGFDLCGWAGNVTEALRLTEKTCPDIAIMDISLPQMDGLTLTERLRQIVPSLHVIVLSGYMDFFFAKRAIDLGVIAYLVKHELTPERLTDTLQKARQEIEKGERARGLFRRQALLSHFTGRGGEVPAEYARGAQLFMIMPEVSPVLDARRQSALLADAATRLNAEPPEGAKCLDALIVEDILMVAVAPDAPINSLGAYRETARARAAALFTRLDALACALASDRPMPVSALGEAFRRFRRHRFDHLFMPPGSIGFLRPETAPPPEPRDLSNLYLERLRREPGQLRDEAKALLDEAISHKDGEALSLLTRHLTKMLEAVLTEGGASLLECPAEAGQIRTHLLGALDALVTRFDARGGYSAITLFAIRYLETNYNQQPSIKEVARQLRSSSMYVGQRFIKDTGRSFHDYLNEIRVAHARTLLATTALKVGEVSRQVGIISAQYFSNLFHESVGVTPNEYRSNHLRQV
jgi:YesN/AraC family two-component response regulator